MSEGVSQSLFSKYVVWRSKMRGTRNRDTKIITCSCLCSAIKFCGETPERYGLWIEPVKEI